MALPNWEKNYNSINTNTSNINKLKPVVLFSGATTGDVTLSETSANFSYMEIYFYGANGSIDCAKVYNPNGKKVNLASFNYYSNWFYFQGNVVSISGTGISRGEEKQFSIYQTGSPVYMDDHNIYISKVVGYK